MGPVEGKELLTTKVEVLLDTQPHFPPAFEHDRLALAGPEACLISAAEPREIDKGVLPDGLIGPPATADEVKLL